MLELHSYFEKLKFCKDMEMGCAEKERRVFEWRPKVTTLMRNDYMLAVRMERWKWIQDILEINRTGDWMKKREWKLRKKSSFLNWPQVRMVVSLVEYKQRESGMSNRTDFFFSDSFLHFYWKVRLLSISHQASFSGFQQCKEDLNSKWVQIST